MAWSSPWGYPTTTAQQPSAVPAVWLPAPVLERPSDRFRPTQPAPRRPEISPLPKNRPAGKNLFGIQSLHWATNPDMKKAMGKYALTAVMDWAMIGLEQFASVPFMARIAAWIPIMALWYSGDKNYHQAIQAIDQPKRDWYRSAALKGIPGLALSAVGLIGSLSTSLMGEAGALHAGSALAQAGLVVGVILVPLGYRDLRRGMKLGKQEKALKKSAPKSRVGQRHQTIANV